MTKRTFIGIKVQFNEALREVFNSLKHELADERIKWVSPQNLHVTLHFLGETTEEQLVKVLKLISNKTSDFSGFTLKLNGLSFFRRQSSPSAVFFNLTEVDELVELVKNIKLGLSKLGFSVGQKFKPHLTLGRINYLRDRSAFYDLMEDFAETGCQLIKVDNIILYESILKPEGPVYKPVKVFPLN